MIAEASDEYSGQNIDSTFIQRARRILAVAIPAGL